MDQQTTNPTDYAEQLAVQMRKGFLAYCTLIICRGGAVYSSDIIGKLREAKLVVVEGTMYPLLSRLLKDGLLMHSWEESTQGPPRKYYETTALGNEVARQLGESTSLLTTALNHLERNA